MMPKIAYVTMQWPVASETFAARDVKALTEMGLDISVYALKPPPKNATALLHSFGVQAIPFKAAGFREMLQGVLLMLLHPVLLFSLMKELLSCEKRRVMIYKSLRLFPSSFWCWRQLKKDKPDIVHLFWGHFPSIAAWLLLKSDPTVKVTIFLGAYDLSYRYGLSARVAEKAPAVFTLAKANYSALQDMGISPDKFHCVYQGVDLDALKNLNRPEKKPGKMVFSGRLIRDKGVHELLDVFKIVAQKNAEAHLVIAGSGPEEEAMRQRIAAEGLEGRVTMTGWVTPDQVYQHVAEAELFVFLSYKEGERLPNAIKEAMLVGAVPVTIFTPGMDELVLDGKNGLIVSDQRPEMIAEEILKVLNAQEAREKMAVAGYQHVLDLFDVRKNMRGYYDVWQKMLY